jgi:hypothetical protein
MEGWLFQIWQTYDILSVRFLAVAVCRDWLFSGGFGKPETETGLKYLLFSGASAYFSVLLAIFAAKWVIENQTPSCVSDFRFRCPVKKTT